MSGDPVLYDLQELSDRARVTPRTVRYYIQQGLLPAPGMTGPGAKYGESHLDRLRLIRGMQREHLPLAEIRRRIEGMSDAEVRERLTQRQSAREVGVAYSSAAADYARGLLDAVAMARAQPMVSIESPALHSPSVSPPPPATERSQWERISLTPDLELHLRRPLSREHNKLVERLLAHARRLLEEESP
ncbi:MAG: MerR family transcriptional regulator [Gemmatimonadales bacterium]